MNDLKQVLKARPTKISDLSELKTCYPVSPTLNDLEQVPKGTRPRTSPKSTTYKKSCYLVQR